MLLRLTPWRRGPLLLLRRPGVALALAAAAFVAALPAAAAPLFLSSAQNATLHRQIDQTCQWLVGMQVTRNLPLGPDSDLVKAAVGAAAFEQQRKAVAEVAAPGLGPQSTTLVTMKSKVVPLDHPGSEDLNVVNLIGKDVDSFRDHVEVLDGPVGPGLWVPDTFAHNNNLKVGDRIHIHGPTTGDMHHFWLEPQPQPYETQVAAIFRDLRSLPDDPYWCSVREVYRGYPGQEFTNDPIVPTAVLDTGDFLAMGTDSLIIAKYMIEYAVADPTMHATEAARVAGDLSQMRAGIGDPETDSSFVRHYITHGSITSMLGHQVERARLVRDGMLPPVLPITAAGVVVGLAVVAAAAVFWVQRRRQELTVLAVHGVNAGGLGVKAVTEALPAILLGTAAGWAGALALVRYTGPGPVLSPEALPLATVAAGGAAVVALGLVGAVAAAHARRLTDQAPVVHRPRWWRRLPWELALLAAAPVAWLGLSDDVTAAPAGGAGEVAHVPARLLVVPILVIAGGAVLAGRLLAWRLRVRGLRRTPARPAALLAWRRIVRDAATTAILAGATAVPIAMATYGASVTDSIRTTADAELRMVIGSDVVASLEPGSPPPQVPSSLDGRATALRRINHQSLDNLTVDVLAVDPRTVRDGVFWDDRINGPTLTDAVDQLTAGPVARVVAWGHVPLGPATLRGVFEDLPVEVVDVRPLPGMRGGYPVVLVHTDAITTDHIFAVHQLWIKGDPAELRDDLRTAGLPLTRIDTIDDLRAGALHEPVTFTFQYLVALSIFTGLIAVVGLLLYLESRTVAHRRAYVLLRRLGLRPAGHRWALLAELALPVLAGLAGGLALAHGLANALSDAFDLDRNQPPGAILATPYLMIAVVSVIALVIAVGAATFAHSRIARANPAEVLRDTP
ncbi:MAG: FtsX-like permease family protein [Micromonosporaceae bacterium]